MEGFDDSTYGDAFADVYDDWYADVTDVDATVACTLDLAGTGGRVLELGVGTGRLALPMAMAGLTVTGIDSSAAMLAVLAEADSARAVDAHLGDMVDDLPGADFDVALAAYNTFFNLLDAERQQACFRSVADRLRPGGRFIVEAYVPELAISVGSNVSVRSMTTDRVVLSVSQHDPDEQRASGQFVEITEAGGVRLRPWAIRWATPGQLDEMGERAGLRLEARWADMAGATFDADAAQHVSVYVR
ncbi:MAG: class I SAM-dependent methyltransferase [Acidimicrobiia bacterium]|nr:class I SAM-dependent methyltransferase [Acidimicrobiia bacterium]